MHSGHAHSFEEPGPVLLFWAVRFGMLSRAAIYLSRSEIYRCDAVVWGQTIATFADLNEIETFEQPMPSVGYKDPEVAGWDSLRY